MNRNKSKITVDFAGFVKEFTCIVNQRPMTLEYKPDDIVLQPEQRKHEHQPPVNSLAAALQRVGL